MIANFNHGHLIGDQLHAVFSQSVQPKHLFIVDDASTDDSVSVIQRLIVGRDNVELVCKKTNSGPIRTANEGLYLANSELVAILAADDLVLPGLFEKSLTLLAQYPEAALCSAVSLVQHRSGDSMVPGPMQLPCSTPSFLAPNRIRALLLRDEGWFMGNTMILRRQPLLAAGGFPSELRSYTDGFIYRVLALRHGACFIPEPLAIWRRLDAGYATSTSRNDEAMEQILIAVNTRMNTDFRDLFPAELIARSNAQFLFRVLCTKLDNFEAGTQRMVEAVQPFGGSLLLLFVVRWARRCLKFLFFCVLRFRDIPRVTLSRIWQRRPPAPGTTQARD